MWKEWIQDFMQEQPRGVSNRDASEASDRSFLKDETGAVLLEYVVLLMMCFLTIQVAIEPLHQALLSFAEDVFTHLSMP